LRKSHNRPLIPGDNSARREFVKDMATQIISKLNKVPEDEVPGQISPSLIPGHEFDMPISQSAHPASSTTADTLNPPQTRGSIPSARRPRPLSMPPQSYTSNTPVLAANSAATPDGSDNKDRLHDENSQRRKHREEHPSPNKPSRSNRILGDYTLSKTLGAGSMGKVKLATHNITGEKVYVFFGCLRPYYWLIHFLSYSWLLKSFLESTPIHPLQPTAPESTMTPHRARLPKMLPRRFGLFAKLPFPCFSIIPTYVACEK
jgi:hypothetical protein